MRVTTQTFWLPKAGNADAEYEDAFWPAEGSAAQPLQGFRCAVGDGATETSFSGNWARLLTRRWCEEANRTGFLESLPSLQQEWERQIEPVPMAWYAEEKARAGPTPHCWVWRSRKLRPRTKVLRAGRPLRSVTVAFSISAATSSSPSR